MQTQISEAKSRGSSGRAPLPRRIPLWLKLAYTGFMAVLIPVYWSNYGPTNFLYFCDMALILTLAGLWAENRLLVSMSAVGILAPQALWVVDFGARLTGHPFLGMTDYMFDGHHSLFLRGLSLFHGWLPFLLVVLVARLGYDRRALPAWTALALALCLISYFFLPPAGAQAPGSLTPVNVDYVFSLDDAKPQTWMSPGAYLLVVMAALPALFFVPTHFALRRMFGGGPSMKADCETAARPTPQPTRATTPATPCEKSWRRGFWSLIVVQFQGAFSDNALKTLVVFLILGLGLPAEKRDTLIPLVGALFATPFLLFSMLGGWLADRFSKRAICRSVKIFEMGVMLFAAAGLGLKNLPMELGAIFLMGAHSAVFGPSKYGLLPELLPLERLSWGNGILELGTFLAIIIGTMAGAFFSAHFAGAQSWSGLLLAALAVGGYAVSAGITRVPAAAPGKPFRPNFAGELWRQLRIMRPDKALWWANWGNTWFFFLAALLQMNLFVHAKDVLRLNDTQNGFLQAALAIGIGVGSLVAGLISRGRIECGLIPIGAIGLAGTAAVLACPALNALTFGLCLTALGFFGGFFIVPVSALLQHRPSRENKGGVLAAANLLSFVGIFAASGAYYVMGHLFRLNSAGIFLLSAGFTGLSALCITWRRPDFLAEFVRNLARPRFTSNRGSPESSGKCLGADPTGGLASKGRFRRRDADGFGPDGSRSQKAADELGSLEFRAVHLDTEGASATNGVTNPLKGHL